MRCPVRLRRPFPISARVSLLAFHDSCFSMLMPALRRSAFAMNDFDDMKILSRAAREILQIHRRDASLVCVFLQVRQAHNIGPAMWQAALLLLFPSHILERDVLWTLAASFIWSAAIASLASVSDGASDGILKIVWHRRVAVSCSSRLRCWWTVFDVGKVLGSPHCCRNHPPVPCARAAACIHQD